MDAAGRTLTTTVSRRAQDDALDATAASLVLAALKGDAALEAAISGQEAASRDESESTPANDAEGKFLAAITIEGFRGIGPPARLELTPGPGLTVVTGRNGSGKSSFAEGAELAVTGSNRRWDQGRTQIWREGWRNLHARSHSRIALDLVGDGPPQRIERRWSEGDDLFGGEWVVRDQAGEEVAITDPGTSVRTYRPFLSYNELGALIDSKPSEMHDSLRDLLGLDGLVLAEKRLQTERRDRDARVKTLTVRKKEVVAQLAEVPDERARQALDLLRGRRTDLDALGDLAAGTGTNDDAARQLRAVGAIELPPADRVTEVLHAVHQAREQRYRVTSDRAEAGTRLASLLREAIAHTEPGSTCPVCERGILDTDWRERADRRLREAEDDAATLDMASTALRNAERELRSVVGPVPTILGEYLPVDASAVVAAWSRWNAALDAPLPHEAAADAIAALRPALAALQETARSELATRDDVWRPVSAALAALHLEARAVAAEAAPLAHLKVAEKWLKSAAVALRNEALAPFVSQSQEVWQHLRQQSSVDLGPVRLEGTTTTRRVAFDVQVDDEAGGALGVMSQGELHSLALSLFLPRVMATETPFRFVLIDDPVQAMDPAKVDGLAKVLAQVATNRQVVVFTHDDRLAESVRRTEVPATILEVSRRERSVVGVRRSSDPVQRYLSDARALLKTRELPDDLRRELVASCCRGALEAAAHEAVRARRLGRGDAHSAVEEALTNVVTLHDVLTLAALDDARLGADLYGELRHAGPGAVDVVRACKKGAHEGHDGDPEALVRGAGSVAAWIRSR